MRRISATQLAEKLTQENPLLLDVREVWEFEICHIEGSINLPMGQIPQQLEQLQQLQTADETVVICHHGVRSQQVINFLQQQSDTALTNLDGGVDAWARTIDPDMPVY
jgi:rhodanese-related sulfurtransferase